MNTRPLFRYARHGCERLGGLLLLISMLCSLPASALDHPVVSSIRRVGQHVVVTASFPPGARSVFLESSERVGPRVWMPRAVARTDGTGGHVVFRLDASAATEVLRVRADETVPLPDVFFRGTNAFAGEVTVEGAVFPGDARFVDAGSTPTEDSREVEESDIYKVRGDTLFFFNQFRGLQEIDITDPDAPEVRGVLALPAAGEQMYLLGDAHVVLLVRSSCYSGSGEESEILVVASPDNAPEVMVSLPVPGHIRESRLVGTALYVASQFYRPVPQGDGSLWEWGTAVTSFDLADPEEPVTRDTLWFAGYGNVVHATDQYFFVVTQEQGNWRQSIVHTIDISDPAGAMQPLNLLRPAGRVPDQFKLHVAGDVFTVISQVQNAELFTTLETFSFADPVHPQKLGELSLGLSERLHATRFAGDLVYVVTFFVQFQMDPLFVVDLSDPTQPTIRGELEIPGWSTFLHPRDDQLVAVGVETNQTTVSLFDVADPEHPALLRRVRVGDGWSWSEANRDEKAFKVLEEEGLILLPFQSWTPDGYVRRVQLIDLGPDTLTVRGAIDHQFAPRRAFVHRERILSLSGWELLSVNFDDRDDPVLVDETKLAWAVDRVAVYGDFVVEVENGDWGWSGEGRPVLRVAPADQGHLVLDALPLGELPVAGIARRDGRLYLAQGRSFAYPIPAEDGDEPSSDPAEPEPNFAVTVIDLERLPELHVLGYTSAVTASPGGGAWQAVWPRDNLLVWSGGGFGYGWWRGGPMFMDRGDALWWPWWGGGGGRLLAFDVRDPADPVLVSEVRVGDEQDYWSFSDACAADGLVYLSHQGTVFVEDVEIEGRTTLHEGRPGVWVNKHFLDVVDYGDPAEPVQRRPVNIPGQLRGLGRDGSLLYTVGYHFDAAGRSDWVEHLEVSAYDGVMAYLVDRMPLPTLWPHPVRVVDPYVYLGVPGESHAETGVTSPDEIQCWTVPDTGRFALAGRTELAQPVNQMREIDGLLAVRETGNGVLVFDRADPPNLRLLGMGVPPGCTWYDIEQADADAGVGLALPLGAYGVHVVPVGP